MRRPGDACARLQRKWFGGWLGAGRAHVDIRHFKLGLAERQARKKDGQADAGNGSFHDSPPRTQGPLRNSLSIIPGAGSVAPDLPNALPHVSMTLPAAVR